MSVQDLVFVVTATSETIYDPISLSSGVSTQVTVTNMGPDDLASLGVYVVPTTTLGDVDNPAQYSPETDYQDLLEWGTATDLGVTAQGGMKLTVPQNTGTPTLYVTRTAGATYATKIPFIDLASGASATFTILLETPPATPARRLFVNIVLE
jgi:hypothetical protein